MVCAEHELVAENAHGLAERLADHRLAAPRDQALDHAGEVALPSPSPQSMTRPVSISP